MKSYGVLVLLPSFVYDSEVNAHQCGEGRHECGCVISHTNEGVSVKLCSAHGYGTDMLPVLRRFVDMFRELEVLHGPRLLAAYTDLLHKAQALLRKVDQGKTEEGRATDEPPADKQKVINFSQRRRAPTE
jgi:hypothetical protein